MNLHHTTEKDPKGYGRTLASAITAANAALLEYAAEALNTCPPLPVAVFDAAVEHLAPAAALVQRFARELSAHISAPDPDQEQLLRSLIGSHLIAAFAYGLGIAECDLPESALDLPSEPVVITLVDGGLN